MSNRELIERLRAWAKTRDMADDLIDTLTQAADDLEACEWRTDMENAPKGESLKMWSARFERVMIAEWGKYEIVNQPDFTAWKPLDQPPVDTQEGET